MLDQTATMLNPDRRVDDGDHRVRESARRLFERLNPIASDRAIAPDAEPLAVYDWEIAKDTKVELGAVRTALRLLNGTAVVVGIVNEEHRVTGLTD
jgi:hypothetical protein